MKEIVPEKQCTPAQLAIAWLLAKDESVIPIPGTKRKKRLLENAGAVDIELSTDEIQRIETIVPIGSTSGTRYPEFLMDTVNI